jgi:branched-chain amino acid transport system ATP-binding protein
MYATFDRLNREGLTILLAEQSIEMALAAANYAYVLQVGRNALSGPAHKLADDPQVQRTYLGIG